MKKVVAPTRALKVLDRAIQGFGAAGISTISRLLHNWANARTLMFADGPDEVRRSQVAKIKTSKIPTKA